MIGDLIGLAIILVALYGIVSFFQRKGEFGHGLDVLMQDRNRIAGEIARLSTDAEFLNVYHDGEAGKTAAELQERMNILTGVFKETVDECDKLANRKYHQFDRQVHLVRVRQSFEKISQEVQRLGERFRVFHEQIEESRKLVQPLQQRFEEVKNRISGILHEKIPANWIQEWRELDRKLTAFSLGEGPDERQDSVAEFSDRIELWAERAEALLVWSEWKQNGQERTKTLVSCRDRLLLAGAGNAHVCKMIDELLETVTEIVSLEPLQLVEKRGILRTERAKEQLPLILSLSMQFLSVFSHPETVANAIRQCVFDANSLLETVNAPDFVNKEQVVMRDPVHTNADCFKDKSRWVDSLSQTVAKVSSLSTISVREAIPYLDVMFSTSARLQKYVQNVERLHLLHTRGTKALRQRVDEMQSKLAKAMAGLAEAGLTKSQQYEKLSKWQEDIYQYEGKSELNVSWIEQYEKRIANELVIIDGLVRGHKSLDTSLQNHLDKLSHSGRYRGRTLPVEVPTPIGQSGAGDLLGAAFGALIIGEMLSDESWDNNFDIW